MLETFINWLHSDNFFNLIKDPKIVAVFLTATIGLIQRWMQPSARIIWGLSHGFSFLIPQVKGQPSVSIKTNSLTVRNTGRSTAKDIEFYFNFKPEHYQVWPIIQHTTEDGPHGRFIIKVPFLKKGEFFSIELIQSIGDIPALLNVRASEGDCKEVPMSTMQVFPKIIGLIIVALMTLGIYQLLVWLLKLINF